MAGNADGIKTRDINEATIKDIANLPFMNEQRARLVVDYREANGPYNSIDDVDNVTGIGEKLSGHLKQYFHVGGSSGSGGSGRSNDDSEDASGRGGRGSGGRGR